MQRARYIPANSTPIESPHGVVYVYINRERPCGLAYAGKQSKSTWHHAFQTEGKRDAKIKEFFDGLADHASRIADRKQQATKPHTLQLGDVIYNSWGYDQTNVDFYEVVGVSSNFVSLQSLNCKTSGDAGHSMSGYTSAVRGTASGKVSKHRVSVTSFNANYVNFKHGSGSRWDGQPLYCSWYA
jgi:hypothetical protein